MSADLQQYSLTLGAVVNRGRDESGLPARVVQRSMRGTLSIWPGMAICRVRRVFARWRHGVMRSLRRWLALVLSNGAP